MARNARTLSAALIGPLLLGLLPTASATAADTMTVHGTISVGSAGTPAGAGEARVTLVNAVTSGAYPLTAPALTDASGGYSLTTARPLSDYPRIVLHVEYLGTGGYLSVWGNHSAFARLSGEAEPIRFLTGSVTFDQTLPAPVSIVGREIRSSGSPVASDSVTATRADVSIYADPNPDVGGSGTSDANGRYTITGLWPGDYSLYSGYSGLGGENPYSTDPLVVTASAPSTTAPDLVMRQDVQIAAGVSCPACEARTELPYTTLTGYTADTIRGGDRAINLGSGPLRTGPAAYTFMLHPGFYRLRLTFGDPTLGSATVTVDATQEGATLTAPPLTPALPGTSRIGGTDRFEVSAALSNTGITPASAVPPGIDTVFIANGFTFPDALATGPVAAASGSPLLLVTETAIPAAVATELARLHPRRIVIVGGPSSVSQGVASRLGGYADTVERIAGRDRFEVSRALALWAHPGGVTKVFLATGLGFADALAAGSAAAAEGAPIITVNGSADTIDAATLDTLSALGATQIDLVGGPASLSPGVEQSLADVPGLNVFRLAGADRITTAQEVNFFVFGAAHSRNVPLQDRALTFVASGWSFPDALGAAALAGRLGMPLELSNRDCIPRPTLSDAETYGSSTVVLVGGPSTLSPAVAALAACP